jgi:outer membrane receptor protein involved in Fe transport
MSRLVNLTGSSKLAIFTLSLMFVLHAAAAHAQEARGPSELEDLSLDQLLNIRVKTASMRQQSLFDAPATSVVITRAQIRDGGYVHLGDILRDLPSVDSYGNFSESFEAQFTIRGHAGNNRFVILKDGIRMNPVTGELISVGENYPLNGVKQVEVIYGPASALYGADAFAGIINLITEDDFGKKNDVALSVGNDGSRRYSGAVGYNFEGRGIQLSAGGHFQTSRNPDLSKAYPRDVFLGSLLDPFSGAVVIPDRSDSFSDKTSSYSFEADLKLKNGLSVGYNERRYNQLTGNGQRPEYNVYGPQLQYRMRTTFAKYQRQWSPRLRTESQFAFSVSELLPDSGYNNFYTNYTRSFKYGRNRSATLSQNLFWDLSHQHHLIAGVSYTGVQSLPETTDLPKRLDEDQAPQGQGFQYPVASGLPVKFYDVHYRNAGVFVQTQSDWGGGFSSTVGIRYDYDSRFGNTVNPRVGVVQRIGKDRAVKVLYGEAFRSPTTAEMYLHFGSFADTDQVSGKPHAFFFHVPNPLLKPEKLRMVELAYVDGPARSVLFSGSIFYSRANNLIVDNGQIPSPGEFAGGIVDHLEQTTNRGRMSTYGGDANITFKLERGGFGIEPWLGYSYVGGALHDKALNAGSADLRYITPHKVKGGVKFFREGYSVVAKFRALGESNHSRMDPSDLTRRLRVPGSVVFDLTMKGDLPFASGYALSLDIQNVLDRKYYTPGGPYDLNYLKSPQAPRTWGLKLSYQF